MAEIALEAPCREVFARCSLEIIAKTISMDAGAINRTTTGLDASIDAIGLSPERLRPRLVEYLDEATAEELRRFLSATAIHDGQLFTRDRKERLRLFTEYLVPGGIHGFCSKTWINRHGATWVTMSRAGRGSRYSEADVSGLDALASVLAVGEALHAERLRSDPATRGPSENVAREHGVSRAEFQVAELVAHGLSNAAIGQVLGRSKHTVRNQLASAFAKLRVATRADLVAALREGTPLASPAGPFAQTLISELERRGFHHRLQ
jgi:DNA-binding CsgD family transcriptional regulator